MAKSKVEELINDINVNLSQRSASQKDEVRVMQEMLNDKSYVVGEYSRVGKVGEYCPSEDARKIVTSIISNGAKVPIAEAKSIGENYEFSRVEAAAMVNLSKEFINTYVQTGRKLLLGGREKMNSSLSLKTVESRKKTLPNTPLTKGAANSEITIPGYNTIKAQGGCPKWLKG